MTKAIEPTAGVDAATVDRIVGRYLAVWSEPDHERRQRAVAGLWSADGVQLIEGAQFRGHAELEARIAEAHREFVASGRFTVASAGDAAGHHDVVTFTVQLTTDAGEVAWAARVVLILGPDGLIRRDYQVTVVPLAPQ